jgi:hypothetical protein
MRMTELLPTGPQPSKDRPPVATAILACCFAIILALVLGVGLASHLVVRHLVQTLPLWVPIILAFRRSRAVFWVVFPLFLFWLFLMAVIWSFLLGLTHFLSGTFSTIEIAMTIIVGLASLIGIVSFARSRSGLSALSAAGLFVVMAAVQFVCFRLSFLPAIAHD